MSSIHRPKEDQNFWNFLFSVFFICVLVAAASYMRSARGGYLVSVPPFDALMLAFATFRITRLLVYDKIARWFRELFAERHVYHKDGVAWVEVRPYPKGLRSTIYDLLQCPWCIGIWASLVSIVIYFVFPWGWFVCFFLAIAGAGSMLQILSNGVGWKAETLKMEAREKGSL